MLGEDDWMLLFFFPRIYGPRFHLDPLTRKNKKLIDLALGQ